MCGLGALIKECKTNTTANEKQAAAPLPIPIYDKPRKPLRDLDTIVGPKRLLDTFTIQLLEGATVKMGETLVYVIDTSKMSNQKVISYPRNIIERGMTEYQDSNSLNKMYNKSSEDPICPLVITFSSRG
jgi:hypothetical protein